MSLNISPLDDIKVHAFCEFLLQRLNKSFKEILACCVQGNIRRLQELIRTGVYLQARDHKGHTPLHQACIHSNLACIELLLKQGIPIDTPDNFGYTSLQLALIHHKFDVYQFLLKNKADITARDKEGKNIMHHAAFEGDALLVDMLIKNHSELVSVLDNEKNSVFHYAANKKDPAVMALLLTKPSLVLLDHQNNLGLRPWHFAAAHGNNLVLELLIDKKPDLIHSICKNKGTPLHYASANGRVDCIHLLLNHGSDINAKGICRMSPIELAARCNHLSAINALRTRGAKLSIPSASLFALQNRKLQILKASYSKLDYPDSIYYQEDADEWIGF
ncbi:ankyrin repeat domain-containing protein [Parashewanella curva]|uniref:Ankyrin repeat domain-containing protein n=1 Tax=Parashewanella curva TaxID=2338552 RepID=A0A3L8PRY8_9GAMM|nr:ankyrin repeat domain-containing protein [Parashewanella curva]RLV58155.1 ankyrin repeat domain-containing protein [Parashewanella curva]